MRVGIDFDNTLVCCAPLFYRVARERNLVPSDLPATKDAVREFLKSHGRESEWTELQGTVYGPCLGEALPFPGAKEFVILCRHKNIPVDVVSHKTRHPVQGPAHNLHDSGQRWLERNGFFDAEGLSRDQVFFEPTRQAKLERIRTLGCTHFIDDLSEVFAEPGFPKGVKKWLFAPDSDDVQPTEVRHFSTWAQLAKSLEEESINDAG